jgi:hemerythrin-like domain-containing protein
VRVTQPIRLSSLVASPAAGFEQPFEMLAACHERMQRMLALLERLRAHLPTHGADTQAQQAARDVMRYFDQAAPQHHRDEELHVFPPLLESGDARVTAVVQQLLWEHAQMEARWRTARAVLLRVAEGSAQQVAGEDEASLDVFAHLYAGHLRAEEEIAYPAALPLLDATAQRAMGEEMMRRRGVK